MPPHEALTNEIFNPHTIAMPSKVYPEGRQTKCPVCHVKYKQYGNLGYACPTGCKTKPDKYRLRVKGDFIYSDRHGQPLDSFRRAFNLLAHITREIENHTFDASRYVRKKIEKFYVSYLLDKYWQAKKDSVALSNLYAYRHDIGLMKEYFKVTDVREIKKYHITKFIGFLKGKYTNTKTVKNKLDALMAFLRWCRDEEYTSSAPPKPKIEVTETENTVWFDNNRRIEIFNAVPQQVRPLFACMMLQTLRPGEARALRCNDIILAPDPRLHIHATFSGSVYRDKRKGRNAKGYFQPIHPEMLEYFMLRKQAGQDNDYVFVNPNTGGPFTKDVYLRAWKKVKAELGLQVKLYQVGKHSTVSLLKREGVDDWSLMKLFGLSNVTTLHRYAHMDMQSMSDKMDKITLIKRQPKK